MPDNSPGTEKEIQSTNTITTGSTNADDAKIPPETPAEDPKESEPTQAPSILSTTKTPVSLTVCTLALVGAAGSWLIAGYFVQSLQQIYPSPTVMAYFSIASLQLYFVFISVPPPFPAIDDTESVVDHDVSDVYTNRETAKIALYLFLPLAAAFTLIIKGLTLFPQSSYCGGMALQSALALLLFVIPGVVEESLTRFKLAAVSLITVAGLLTVSEPALLDPAAWTGYASIGYLLLLAGILLLTLVWCLVARFCEHTNIQKPLIFAFIGLLWMLSGWTVFIPLHLFGVEPLQAFPPDARVYWYLLLICLLGACVPVYLIGWTLSRTSVLFVGVGLGAIVPLHWVSEAIYLRQWSWINFGAAVISIAGIVLINTRYVT